MAEITNQYIIRRNEDNSYSVYNDNGQVVIIVNDYGEVLYINNANVDETFPTNIKFDIGERNIIIDFHDEGNFSVVTNYNYKGKGKKIISNYDSNGNVINNLKIEYSFDGTEKWKTVTEYTEVGTKVTEYGEGMLWSEETIYNEEVTTDIGLISEKIEYDVVTGKKSKETVVYTDETEITEYNGDSKKVYSTFYSDGSPKLYVEYDSNGQEKIRIEYSRSKTKKIEYNALGEKLITITYSDGKVEYFFNGEKTLTLLDDEHFSCVFNGEIIEGTFYIDDSGYIICKDANGNEFVYKKGELSKRTIFGLNEGDRNLQRTQLNGQDYYSMNNHINYDEEMYQNLMLYLNSLNDSFSDKVRDGCTKIENTINGFNDSCNSEIGIIYSNLNNHLKQVVSLKENVNYSLLAYQTCDQGLKDWADKLIDNLFMNESNLGENFRRSINSTIEDRNNDNIFEYKESTNFKSLSKSVIPVKYMEVDGNILYFNSNNKLIGLDGNKITMEYGGKGDTFNISINENGMIIIRDSQNNPLNIFADYNLEIGQYGGNQMDLNNADLLLDNSMQALLEKYIPQATDEEKLAFLSSASEVSCGYTAMTNIVFKYFEGKEQEFYNTFGYPMYEVTSSGESLSIDYNYEPLIIDLFCHANNVKESNLLLVKYNYFFGTDDGTFDRMYNYLEQNYGMSLGSGTGNSIYTFIAEKGYTLYEMDGDVYAQFEPGEGYHAMTIVDYTDDGKPIVSSWGKKYILERSQNEIDIPWSRSKDFHI